MAHVGIVLVSHSEKAAAGICEILQQVVGEIPVEAAGGLEGGEIGTNFERIQTAIQNIHNEKGTIVFYDIGSAQMNAEMAIETLGFENVHLASAPILEGAYLAAVESSVGKSVEEIFASLNKEFK
ncbi:MAG: dihydroxyacetone kinase phosphoryl donor subunit DhaM [Halobacillus sp.]|uniref:dihydroxyacetone kinase phosphoryl donor subunit DhaM n=1 Tax=Halobacillus sp. TaxID=56800 RepID=UPI003BAF5066